MSVEPKLTRHPVFDINSICGSIRLIKDELRDVMARHVPWHA
jgi:hypothetical protein